MLKGRSASASVPVPRNRAAIASASGEPSYAYPQPPGGIRSASNTRHSSTMAYGRRVNVDEPSFVRSLTSRAAGYYPVPHIVLGWCSLTCLRFTEGVKVANGR
jgi:hypothetical protein